MAELIKKRLINLFFGKTNTLLENIAVCLGVTLASAFMFFENRGFIPDFLRVFLSGFIFLVWITCAFSAGKSKKWGFLVFTCLYWLIPNLYLVFYSLRDNVRGYSKWLSLLNKSSDILANKPFEYLSGKLGCEEYYLAIFLFIIVISTYIISVNLTAIIQRKEKEERFGY